MKSTRMFVTAAVAAGAALVAAALPATLAGAQDTAAVAAPPAGGPHHGGPGHEFGPMHLYHQLGLSTEQQAEIKSILTAARPAMQSLQEQERANEGKLRKTSPDDPNYASVSAEVSQTHGNLASQVSAERAEVRAQIYALLTPAQKTQLTALEAKAEAAGPGHWGHGPAGGPPPEAQ